TSGGWVARIPSARSMRPLPRKSGVRISILVPGVAARMAAMQSTKCWAPPSRRSSRSTEVTTTYFRPMSATVAASRRGSSGSGGLGRPWATSQKLQRRVQTSPRIMNVAVPWPKHSWMLGQLASSHTVTSRLARSLDFSAATAPLEGIRTRIQEGLRSTGASTNSTGERAILSPATCLAPGTSGAGASPTTDSGMDFGWAVSDMRGCRWRDGRSRCVLRRQPQLRGKGRDQGALGGLETCGTPAVYHRGHGEAGVAAGVDAVEGRQVHGDVEGQAVEAAAVAHPDAERGDRGAIHVDARGALAALAADAPAGQGVDDGLLDPAHVLAHAEAQAAQVQERVGHQLAGAVVGDLAAAIHLEHRDVAGRQQVLRTTGLAEGEHGVVLDQPQLVGRGLV